MAPPAFVSANLNLVIRIGIVEDQPEIREGLALLIGTRAGFSCVGSWSSMEDALSVLERDTPEVLLVDIALGGMSGIDGINILKQKHPKLLMLVLTVYEDDERIFDAVCAGACGYLLKKTPPDRLLEAIAETVEGGSPMSPIVARRVLELFRQQRPSGKPEHHLTPHQVRVLRLLVQGHNYKSAAQELGVTANTIAFHVQQIYATLHVHSKSEAVAKALRERIVS